MVGRRMSWDQLDGWGQGKGKGGCDGGGWGELELGECCVE